MGHGNCWEELGNMMYVVKARVAKSFTKPYQHSHYRILHQCGLASFTVQKMECYTISSVHPMHHIGRVLMSKQTFQCGIFIKVSDYSFYSSKMNSFFMMGGTDFSVQYDLCRRGTLFVDHAVFVISQPLISEKAETLCCG